MRIWITAFMGWIYCSAIMGLGQRLVPMPTLLIIHLIAAPAGFTVLSVQYFRKSLQSPPLQTAIFFTGFIVIMDFIVVALLILRDLTMFRSPIGTWIPFGLIFISVWSTGLVQRRRRAYE